MVDLRAVRRLHHPEEAPASPHMQASTGDENDADLSEDNAPLAVRAPRHSKPSKGAKPTQLQFYSAPWVNLLVKAKNNYRFSMHVENDDPFPARTPDNLAIAHDSLLEVIAKLPEQEKVELDECSSFFSRY